MLEPMLDEMLLGRERIRPLLRREYEVLVDRGMLDDERVELLRGVLVEMSPQSEPHSRITAWFAQVLIKALSMKRYDVRSHSPFRATEDSMPEPDVSVSRRTGEHPDPRTALLLIEVSGSSLTKDRTIKNEVYAEAGVPEYWIVNMKTSVVTILRDPGPRGYRRSRDVPVGGVLRPLRFRGVTIAVDDIPWMQPGESDEPDPRSGRRRSTHR
jgi:Uma2 family endonuclease